MKGTSRRSCNDLKPYIHACAGRRLVADGKGILPIRSMVDDSGQMTARYASWLRGDPSWGAPNFNIPNSSQSPGLENDPLQRQMVHIRDFLSHE